MGRKSTFSEQAPATAVDCPYRSKLVDEITAKLNTQEWAEPDLDRPDVDHEAVLWRRKKKKSPAKK